ncbi:hypothetical protein [Serratia liquefaciens]|uniref:hypothetical protein n=1 Tax=Serratia liquefaciens TaxID=614 RepID=UPI0007235D83|nr:hypothetical protein [Serratia liquefaciens]GAK26254.1 hypothetical protein SLIQ_06245 [Serratia liquefaciens FK01]
MTIRSKLVTPLGYFFIKHPEKRWFDIAFPVLFSAIIVLIISYMPKHVSLIGKDSLISLVNGILQILSGFYIASMAAVATFQKDGMDEVMDGEPPKLKGKPLTRRQFMTHLFGYLAFLSIVLYFVGGALQLAGPSIKDIELFSNVYVRILALFLYLFAVSNILFTTALGMFFMIDKMHENKPKLQIKPIDEGKVDSTDKET